MDCGRGLHRGGQTVQQDGAGSRGFALGFGWLVSLEHPKVVQALRPETGLRPTDLDLRGPDGPRRSRHEAPECLREEVLAVPARVQLSAPLPDEKVLPGEFVAAGVEEEVEGGF